MKPIAKPAPANATDMPTVLDLFFCFTNPDGRVKQNTCNEHRDPCNRYGEQFFILCLTSPRIIIPKKINRIGAQQINISVI